MLSLLQHVRQYDVVHVFSASYYSFLLSTVPAILISKLFGKIVLVNYRSGEASDHLRHWRSAVMMLRLAHRIVVPSNYLVGVFQQYQLSAIAIPNFVELSQFHFRPRKPIRPVFLSNRNLQPLYNISCTLRAFAQVQGIFPDATLVIAGDGVERRKLEKQASSLKLRNVTFLGQVSPEKMPALYNNNDIYLNSPNIDNMPTSVIEAFASGLPVVTSDAGGIPLLIAHERTGLIFSVGEHKAMAASILRLLTDDELAQSIIESARTETVNYTWTHVRSLWLQLYLDLAAPR
jgi:glycosyltransferase involved in cell wall biosynthesis